MHVATLCSDKDGFPRLMTAGMNEAVFLGIDPEERKMFLFTREWYLRDGTVPPRSVLEDEFEQLFKDPQRIIPDETEVQPEYVVSVLKNNAVKANIQVITEDAVKRIFEQDANQVHELAATHRAISNLYMSVSGSKHVKTMEEAMPQTLETIFQRAEDNVAYQEGLVKFPYSILDLTYYGGVRPRELAVFFGYTGDMKSLTVEYGSLINALGHQLLLPGETDPTGAVTSPCVEHEHPNGKRVAHFTFENGIETTTTRMLSMLTGVPMGKLFEGVLPPDTRELLRRGKDVLERLPIQLDESPGTDERSVEAVFTKARTHEAQLVIIDQSSWIVSPEVKYKSQWENYAAITRKIQEHTNELEVVTFLASQANRESQKTKKGTGLAHIAGSDEITKTASYVVSLDFDETQNLLLCSVVKARGGKKGLQFNMDVQLDTTTKIQLNQVLTV